jgi:tryptophanyl-tRNA synthetase
MSKETILTGIRSNGELTLGNYLGAILPMVQLQREKAGEYQINMFVPDLHSFTTPVDHTTLLEHARINLRIFAASGLDFGNADTFIYRQSYIPAHSELFTILNNFAYVGELSRMTQFKDKSDGKDNVSGGLFTYPVLMAADILLYGAHWVPVGEDQRQHLELTRDLAIRMNNKFGELFTVPYEWQKQLAFSHRGQGVRIRSLSDPTKKMSKSIEDPRGTILLSDTPADAAKKVMSATTDSFGVIDFDFKERPGISNLLQILALLSERELSSVVDEWKGKTSYGDLKKATSEAVEHFLSDFQAKFETVDDEGIRRKLEESEAALTPLANEQLLTVQRAVGLR